MPTQKTSNASKIIITIISLLFIAIIFCGAFIIKAHVTPEAIDVGVTATDIGSEPPYKFDYSWTEKSPYIAHALGGILGESYTNSYEAFLLNYELGHRVFEADFSITEDGKTVLAHDENHWRANAPVQTSAAVWGGNNPNPEAFAYDNFMSSLWYSKFHPLDLTRLFQIMQKYPDIYIVTDTKFFDEPNVRLQFNEFVTTAREIDASVLDRLIIQIYRPEMLDWVMDIYPWKSVIYTLYANPEWTPDNVLEFSQASGVKFITLPGSWLSSETATLWSSANLITAVHTLNDLSSIEHMLPLGVDIFYTDFLLPN